MTERVSFHCLGGFVVTMLNGLARSTADVDVVTFVPPDEIVRLVKLAGKGSELHRRLQVYLDPVTIVQIPEDYDERLTRMFPHPFEWLQLFALDPDGLALSKTNEYAKGSR